MKNKCISLIAFFICIVIIISTICSCSLLSSSNTVSTPKPNNTKKVETTTSTSSSAKKEEVEITIYHSFNEVVVIDDDNLSFTLSKVEVQYFLTYPGTKDLRGIEFNITIENLSKTDDKSINRIDYPWILYLDGYKYTTKEVYGVGKIQPGGKMTARVFFYVPDNIYQSAKEFSLQLDKQQTSYVNKNDYRIYWSGDLPRPKYEGQ